MADSDSTTQLSAIAPELNESRTELLGRIQGLEMDMENWRSKLDTLVKVYREELTQLKKTLNVEVEDLRSEFQELRTTLQKQQEDVAASLSNLGLQDVSGDVPVSEDSEVNIIKGDEAEVLPIEDNNESKPEELTEFQLGMYFFLCFSRRLSYVDSVFLAGPADILELRSISYLVF